MKEIKAESTKKAEGQTCFACAEEAAALLNCVADKKYNDMRCLPLMKKLRACIEKKVRLPTLSGTPGEGETSRGVPSLDAP